MDHRSIRQAPKRARTTHPVKFLQFWSELDNVVLASSEFSLLNFLLRTAALGTDLSRHLDPWTSPTHHWRRARYIPTSMTAPPTSFSIPSTSLKKTMPEATPVMVIKYW